MSKAISLLKEVKGVGTFEAYEDQMVAATELITLARMKRGTHLLQHPEKQVISATNVSLEEGKSTEDIEAVRKANAEVRGQRHIPLIDVMTLPVTKDII